MYKASFKSAGEGTSRNVRGQHSRSPGYEPFNHWVECESCGFDVRAEDIRERWDGLLCCPADWEPRHPQDFVRSTSDTIAALDPVNPPSPVEGVVTTESVSQDSAVAGIAIAGLAVAGVSSTSTVISGSTTLFPIEGFIPTPPPSPL